MRFGGYNIVYNTQPVVLRKIASEFYAIHTIRTARELVVLCACVRLTSICCCTPVRLSLLSAAQSGACVCAPVCVECMPFSM